ncbi:MAG: hypothetical protein R2771_16360, partial [Saprospiraceae bacterium]
MKNRFYHFILMQLFVIVGVTLNAQNPTFKNVNGLDNSQMIFSEDIKDLKNLSGWYPGNDISGGNSFHISKIENSKIVEGLENVEIIPVAVSGRELPVGLYINNNLINTEETDIEK